MQRVFLAVALWITATSAAATSTEPLRFDQVFLQAMQLCEHYFLPNSMAREPGFDINAYLNDLDKQLNLLAQTFASSEGAAFLRAKTLDKGDGIAKSCAEKLLKDAEAGPPIDATRWEGLYRNAQGEVMRVQAMGAVIAIDIFVRQDSTWEPTTMDITVMRKADYAEFHDRVEPDGLWLSLSFLRTGVFFTSHDPAKPKAETSFFKRLDESEAQSITGLPKL